MEPDRRPSRPDYDDPSCWELAGEALDRAERKLRSRTRAKSILIEATIRGTVRGIIDTTAQDYDVYSVPLKPVANGFIDWIRHSEPGAPQKMGPGLFRNRRRSAFISDDEEWIRSTFADCNPPKSIVSRKLGKAPTTLAPRRHITFGLRFYIPDVDALIDENLPLAQKQAKQHSLERAVINDRVRISLPRWRQILKPLRELAAQGRLGDSDIDTHGHGAIAALAKHIAERLLSPDESAGAATLRRYAKGLLETNKAGLRTSHKQNDQT